MKCVWSTFPAPHVEVGFSSSTGIGGTRSIKCQKGLEGNEESWFYIVTKKKISDFT